jgi:hypothetical protein
MSERFSLLLIASLIFQLDRLEARMQSGTPDYLKGAVFGLAAVSIWAGWSVMTRLAVTTNLSAWDIPAPGGFPSPPLGFYFLTTL